MKVNGHNVKIYCNDRVKIDDEGAQRGHVCDLELGHEEAFPWHMQYHGRMWRRLADGGVEFAAESTPDWTP